VTIGNSVTSMGTTLYSGPFDGCTPIRLSAASTGSGSTRRKRP
jgi:hypothetical protein